MVRLPYPLYIALACLWLSWSAQGAEWYASPSVTFRTEYNDNFRLSANDPKSVWGAILGPSLVVGRNTPLWELSASGRLKAARYTGQSGLDRVDNYFNLDTKRRFERGSLNAGASLINDSTLQTESLDLDTGLTLNQLDRRQTGVVLSGQYLFTETTWIEASTAYRNIDYDGGETDGLFDYDSLTPGLRVIHQLNPKTQLFSILSHSRVEYDSDINLESTTNSLQLGADYDLTELWHVSAAIGSRRTETSRLVPTGEFEVILVPELQIIPILAPRQSKSTGLVYNVGITRKSETGHISLTATQAVSPSSTGTDTEMTNITLQARHEYSAKLSTNLAVSYNQSSAVGGTRTRADNDRYRVSPSLSWRLNQDLSLNAGYTYTYVKRGPSSDDTVDGNAVFISLGYNWPRLAMSR